MVPFVYISLFLCTGFLWVMVENSFIFMGIVKGFYDLNKILNVDWLTNN